MLCFVSYVIYVFKNNRSKSRILPISWHLKHFWEIALTKSLNEPDDIQMYFIVFVLPDLNFWLFFMENSDYSIENICLK